MYMLLLMAIWNSQGDKRTAWIDLNVFLFTCWEQLPGLQSVISPFLILKGSLQILISQLAGNKLTYSTTSHPRTLAHPINQDARKGSPRPLQGSQTHLPGLAHRDPQRRRGSLLLVRRPRVLMHRRKEKCKFIKCSVKELIETSNAHRISHFP